MYYSFWYAVSFDCRTINKHPTASFVMDCGPKNSTGICTFHKALVYAMPAYSGNAEQQKQGLSSSAFNTSASLEVLDSMQQQK